MFHLFLEKLVIWSTLFIQIFSRLRRNSWYNPRENGLSAHDSTNEVILKKSPLFLDQQKRQSSHIFYVNVTSEQMINISLKNSEIQGKLLDLI